MADSDYTSWNKLKQAELAANANIYKEDAEVARRDKQEWLEGEQYFVECVSPGGFRYQKSATEVLLWKKGTIRGLDPETANYILKGNPSLLKRVSKPKDG